jgi:hypothetical protein
MEQLLVRNLRPLPSPQPFVLSKCFTLRGICPREGSDAIFLSWYGHPLAQWWGQSVQAVMLLRRSGQYGAEKVCRAEAACTFKQFNRDFEYWAGFLVWTKNSQSPAGTLTQRTAN